MQTIFDVTKQENLFSILASKNKRIYFKALMVLRACYQEELRIRRGDLVSYLIHQMEDELFLLSPESDLAGDEDPAARSEIDESQPDAFPPDTLPPSESAVDLYENASTLSGRAHALVRRLIHTGWLEVVPDDRTFDELLLVPEYASGLLDVFHAIVNPTEKVYNSYVYATYSSLKTANEEREYMFQALQSAYDNTKLLLDSLRSLLHNIHRFYQSLQDRNEIRELLAEHFDEYQVMVAAKTYHPLKTVDSVHRFRPRILQILRDWLVDDEVLTQIVQSMPTGYGGDDGERRYEAIRMMQFILDSFESMDAMLSEIDRRNTNYSRASVERIQYLLNTDRSVKGKLIEILKRVPKLDSDEPSPLVDEMSKLPIYQVRSVDPDGLYTEKTRRVKEKPQPLKLTGTVSEAEFAREAEELVERATSLFSDEEIIRFILNQMSADGVLQSKDLNLKEVEDYLRTLIAVIKSDEAAFPFRVEWDGGSEFVLVDGYRIPVMAFVRARDE